MVIQKLDTTKYAVIKLGICGTAIGLILDSYILYNSSNIFSQLSSQQIISFTIWMVIAYALYLLIPFVMERKSCCKEVCYPLYNNYIPERSNNNKPKRKLIKERKPIHMENTRLFLHSRQKTIKPKIQRKNQMGRNMNSLTFSGSKP